MMPSLEGRIDELVRKLDHLMEVMGGRAAADDGERSLTTEEAAAFLRVHKQEILRYTKSGLPFYEDMGRGFKFLKRDLIAFRENYREVPRSLRTLKHA